MASDIRVCHVTTIMNWGGVERLILDTLSYQGSTGIRSSLLCTVVERTELLDPIRQLGIPIYEPRRRYTYDFSEILRMSRWMREQGVQVIHSYNSFANSWANAAALIAGLPAFVASDHGAAWYIRPPMDWSERWAYRRSKLIITPSLAGALMLRERYKVPQEKIRVLYNPAAPLLPGDRHALRTELGINTPFVIGSIGRLAVQKHFKSFVDAAARVLLKRTDVTFVIVGGGEQEQALRAQATAAGIADRVIITGWRSDARALLQAFDMFVSTSIYENLPIALIEAAMVGLPIIAPCVDGIPEVVIDRETGLLLHPTLSVAASDQDGLFGLPRSVVIGGRLQPLAALDPDCLANAMLELLQQPDLCQKFGLAGQERARKLFSLDQYMAGLERIYAESVVQKRSG